MNRSTFGAFECEKGDERVNQLPFDVPYVFKHFAFFVDQESWAFPTIEDLAKHGLRGVLPNEVEEFAAFVSKLEDMTSLGFDLETFWNKSPSEVLFVGGNYVLTFLKLAVDIARTEGTEFDEEGDGETIRYVNRRP